MKKIVKSHHIVYIILGIILIAGVGTGVYFYVHNESTKPNITPTECKKGQTVCRDAQGQSTCCDHGCCKTGEGEGIGVCLNEDQKCVNNKPCDGPLVCKQDNSDNTICCDKDKPNCNKASGTCNNCTPASPECGGQESLAPTCCTTDKCYDDQEIDKTSDNPCVCCNGNVDGVQGMGGNCCSKNRCLCPGEYYGRKDVSGASSNIRTRKSDGTCALKGKPQCIKSEEKGIKELTDIAIDDSGEICNKNNIYFNSSTKQWLCCNNIIYWDSNKKSLQCCSDPNAKVGTSSICYSDPNYTGIDTDSPLYGMCSGIDDSHLNVDVCVNTKNFRKSTFSKPANDNCSKTGETIVSLPYYEIINQPGIISYVDKDHNQQTIFPQTLNQKQIKNIKDLNTFTAKKCSQDADCSNKKSSGCVDKNGQPIYDKNGKQITNCDVTNGQYPQGECGTGCPADSPTTICGEGEICYTYDGKNSDGNQYTSGFCGKLPSTTCQQKPESQQMPEHLQTMDDIGNNLLHYKTLAHCQNFCETKRNGYCLGDANDKYYCHLPTCTDGKANYIVQGAANMTSTNTITFDSPPGTCSMTDCMLLQNKQHVKDISYDTNESGATCTANFDCSAMLVDKPDVENTWIYGANAEKSGFTGELLYYPSGKQYKFRGATPFGPYTNTSMSTVNCNNDNDDPVGKYCINGNTCNNGTCSPPAGIF